MGRILKKRIKNVEQEFKKRGYKQFDSKSLEVIGIKEIIEAGRIH